MENNFYILCLGTLTVNNGVQQERKEGKEESGNTQAEPGEESSNLENKESRKSQAQPSSIPKFLGSGISIKIPDCLNTPEVWATWRVCISEKWVDGNLRPLISRAKISVVAYRIYVVHNLPFPWKFFELLWGYNNMRNNYQTALNEMQYDSFRKQVENLIR